jgi:ABC-type transport system involved in cytochrome bd biosynthesis fused ATPase/permease subunit
MLLFPARSIRALGCFDFMSRKIMEIIGYISGALGIIGFIVSAFELNNVYLRRGLWVFIAVSAVVTTISLIKVNAHDKAIKCLQNVIDNVSGHKGYEVKYVQNLGELSTHAEIG